MVVMVIVSILLVLIVLMQRPKQEGLGAAFGGGMMDSVAGAHTTDVLQKGTIWLAAIFMGSAILVSVLQAKQLQAEDVGEVLPEAPAEPALPPSIGDLPSTLPPVGEGGGTPAPAPATGGETGTDAPSPAPAEGGDEPPGDAGDAGDAAPGSAEETSTTPATEGGEESSGATTEDGPGKPEAN